MGLLKAFPPDIGDSRCWSSRKKSDREKGVHQRKAKKDKSNKLMEVMGQSTKKEATVERELLVEHVRENRTIVFWRFEEQKNNEGVSEQN